MSDDDYIIRRNIDRFNDLLLKITDETQRRTINILLAEQNEQLKRLEATRRLAAAGPVRQVLPKA
jgi:hypothetical protein